MFRRNIHVEELRARLDLKTKLENPSISKSYDQNKFSIVFIKEMHWFSSSFIFIFSFNDSVGISTSFIEAKVIE